MAMDPVNSGAAATVPGQPNAGAASGGGATAGSESKPPEFYAAEAKRAFEARDAARAEAAAAKAERDQLAAEKAERDAEARKAKENAELQVLESKGQYEAAIQKTHARFETEKNETQKRHEAMLKRTLIPLSIRAAALEVPDLTPEAARDLPMLLAPTIGIDPGTGEAFVAGPDGAPLKDPETLKPVPIQDHIKKFVSARPYMLKDRMARTTGLTPAGAAGGEAWSVEKALKDPAYMMQWQKADPDGKARAFAEHWAGAQQRAETRFKP